MHSLSITQQAEAVLAALESDGKRLRRVQKALAQLENDPRHPGLSSHAYETLKGPLGEKIWESYVENNTPSAWRIWWYYGPEAGEITVVEIGPHP
jgi:hypothetical protein